MEKRIVNFFSEGVRMEGDLFLPDGLKAGERLPGIVLCHGFTGIRSVILGDYAKVFVAAGFVALTFDYRSAFSAERRGSRPHGWYGNQDTDAVAANSGIPDCLSSGPAGRIRAVDRPVATCS